MAIEIECAITKAGADTTFEFMLPNQTVKITVPAALNDEECATVIQCFVESITTASSNGGATSS